MTLIEGGAYRGEYLGTTSMRVFAQGKGGFGGPRGPTGEPAWSLPERAPDAVVSLPVGLNQSGRGSRAGGAHRSSADVP